MGGSCLDRKPRFWIDKYEDRPGWLDFLGDEGCLPQPEDGFGTVTGVVRTSDCETENTGSNEQTAEEDENAFGYAGLSKFWV